MRNHRPAQSFSSWLGCLPGLCRIVGHRAFTAMMVLLLAATTALAQTAPATPPQLEAPATPPADMNKPSADASGGQLRELDARPVLRLRGQSTWDEGFSSFKAAIEKLGAESRRLGLAAIENPLAHFLDSDDLGFTYEVYQPLAAEPPSGSALADGLDVARSPSGRVMVFAHEGAYDEIDSAYEAITAWLDEKGLTATGKFMEEYVFLPEKADDPGMKLNIFVFLK